MNVNSVAVFLPCLLTGGTEVATLETALALKSLGYNVDVIVYFAEVDAVMLETFQLSGFALYLLGVKRVAGLRTHWILAIKLLRLLCCKSYKAIWVQYMTPTLLPLIMARLFTRHLITSVHVAASHYSPAGLQRLRWLACYWCDRSICVSQTVATGILKVNDVMTRVFGRVVVIPNALDMTLVQAAVARDWRSDQAWSKDVVVLGFSGRLAHIKGADVLLQALALLHQQDMPVRLVVVGDGAEQSKLKALTQQLNIDAITHFAGRLPRSEIYGAIKGFDIAVVPSREEGFGLSALEAMAAGVPLVASRVDALQEVVLDYVTGLLCEVDDPVSLDNALARLVRDVEFRHRLGAAGEAHATLFYDVSAYRARLADLLRSMGLPVRSVRSPA